MVRPSSCAREQFSDGANSRAPSGRNVLLCRSGGSVRRCGLHPRLGFGHRFEVATAVANVPPRKQIIQFSFLFTTHHPRRRLSCPMQIGTLQPAAGNASRAAKGAARKANESRFAGSAGLQAAHALTRCGSAACTTIANSQDGRSGSGSGKMVSDIFVRGGCVGFYPLPLEFPRLWVASCHPKAGDWNATASSSGTR
jgi:hypothetical protein